jgi:hypothetical protein
MEQPLTIYRKKQTVVMIESDGKNKKRWVAGE